jgi:protoporphyrin/coproporphyrin ferrochelatase
MNPKDGILLVGHGTVADLADIPAFLARIRRGRPASDALVADVTSRYRRVGGSPFLQISRAQAAALAERVSLPVLLGMRMWDPAVEGALREAAARRFTRLCVLPLAPFSVHVYAADVVAARERLVASGEAMPEVVAVAPWGSQPNLVEAEARLVERCLEGHRPETTRLVLSAHSLPRIAIERGDPYQQQFEALAKAVFARLGWPGTIAYQSQGADGGDWLGPDVRATLEGLRSDGIRRVVWAPAGFLTDHVETLYDLDVEAAAWASELGLELTRVPALNSDPGLIEAMACAARAALGGEPGATGDRP